LLCLAEMPRTTMRVYGALSGALSAAANEEMASRNIQPADFHGPWNATIAPSNHAIQNAAIVSRQALSLILRGRLIGRQLGSRRIRQDLLALVNTGRFSPDLARTPVLS
jgi:hypothetical protein